MLASQTVTTPALPVLEVTVTPGRAARIGLRGELDAATHGGLSGAFETLLATSPQSVCLDLGGVWFVSSEAIATVVRAAGVCAARGIAIEVVLSEEAERVFELCGLLGADVVRWRRTGPRPPRA